MYRLLTEGLRLDSNVKLAQSVKLVSWPSPQDYNEAVQEPQASFADPELSKAVPELTEMGLPRAMTGMFASVYRLCSEPREWAVRCFLHKVPDQHKRYELIEEHLTAQNLSCTVGFDFQTEGVMINSHWYPILKMEWCQGQTLDLHVTQHLNEPEALGRLAESFKDMALALSCAGIAHGDLQHGNILVNGDEVRLVDYDGMYVPALAGYRSIELGHRNYQHPARTETDFGSFLDNFSAWLIYLSLKILAIDPSLWGKLDGGDECLLLRCSDLEEPLYSHAFRVLESHPSAEIQTFARLIRYFLALPVDAIPALDSAVVVPADLPPLAGIARLPDWIVHSKRVAAASRGELGWQRLPESAALPPAVRHALLSGYSAPFHCRELADRLAQTVRERNSAVRFLRDAGISVLVLALLFGVNWAMLLAGVVALICAWVTWLAADGSLSILEGVCSRAVDTVLHSKPQMVTFSLNPGAQKGATMHPVLMSGGKAQFPVVRPYWQREGFTSFTAPVYFDELSGRPIAALIDGQLHWFI